MIVRAKLCGIRSDRDLEIAITAGADAIGLICGTTHVSEDALTPDQARRLAAIARTFVSTVLVTHLNDPREMLDIADHIGVDTIQVHGLVTADAVAEVFERAAGRRIIKAVHLPGADVMAEALELAGVCHAILLDSRTGDRLGGTGRTHDWTISRQITDALRDRGRPVILAGGLRAENVVDAVRAVRPCAVDVNSGVEDPQGDKLPEACAAFVSRSREALAAVVPIGGR